QPRPIAFTVKGPSFLVFIFPMSRLWSQPCWRQDEGRAGAPVGRKRQQGWLPQGKPATRRERRLLLRVHEALETVERFVGGQDFRDRSVRLAAFLDGAEELAVLQFDAVHGDVHF